MHKKVLGISIAVLLVSALCFAQSVRNPSYNQEGKSNFGRIGITGLDTTGNPGFIEINGNDGIRTNVYYLWVDNTGDLRIASYSAISAFSSFPNGDWTTDEFIVGTVVGTQS